MQRLGWFATFIAALTSPVVVAWFINHGHSLWFSIVMAVLFIGAFRGAIDLALKNLVAPPELTLDSEPEDMTADALMRRRHYFWARKFRLLGIITLGVTIVWLFRGGSWLGTWSYLWSNLALLANPQVLMQLIILPIFFLANFLLFFGPMMMMGISQMQGLEPGDADFGVRLDDVRGQKEAKAEIRKVVTLWQSGAKFIAAGGKRERGVLFLGPPGTGKTMLAKAIATGFNCPIVLMPGSGFAQTFIGMDVIIVRYMARKARKLAAKWSGSCIIFIDEIDAVGMRRAALGGGYGGASKQVPGGGMGGMMGGMGQMGLQSLLVVMDGIDNPPFFRKLLTNKINMWLDAMYIIPSRAGKHPLRLPKARPTSNQIFFVGATNVPLESLDPALTRPGRMGRHIHFRSPTKRDRLDIFDLYLGKVGHEADLDADAAREELARVTDGYSPAQIEQVCSLALSYAHHSGRAVFSRRDILEAMVTVEAGMALDWGYESAIEERAVAIHEAGHAVCSNLYEKNVEAIRLSVRKRGDSGGHHMAVEGIERFVYDRAELMGRLVTLLGAYAAEFVTYGHNSQGVGGDLAMASHLAGTMVGHWGMAPMPMPGARAAHEKKLIAIGNTLVATAYPGDIGLSPSKSAAEALILGQAFVIAWNAVRANREALSAIADALVEEKEIYGDDLARLLDRVNLTEPVLDWGRTGTYPSLGRIPAPLLDHS